ncbi:MAG: hypothetical protein ABI383_10110 [Acidobacteriaceae bacterium]
MASSWPRFRADEKGRRNQHGSRHAGPYASGPAFRSGEPVKETGIYEVTHQVEHRAEHEVVLLSGDTFPRCETCQSEVAFRMIRTAPYIFQDADFEES